MRFELQDRCGLLIKNREIIKAAFKWESDTMIMAGSSLLTSLGLLADVEKLQFAEKILKENTNTFSDFRSNVKTPLLCKMSLADDPEKYFHDVEVVYKIINKSKWLGSEYKIIAAITIVDHDGISSPEYYVERTNEIYKKMKEKHKWLTSDEDIPFAAMLAMSEIDIDFLIEEMERCYEEAKETFKDSNARQTLSHVMALDSMPANIKCQKAANIWKALKEEKHKYGRGYEIAVLGVLSCMDIGEQVLVRDIIEADEWLKKQKGFGTFGIGAEQRRMYAALMVLNSYQQKVNESQEAALAASIAIMVQMEICMMLLMTSTIAATTAAR